MTDDDKQSLGNTLLSRKHDITRRTVALHADESRNDVALRQLVDDLAEWCDQYAALQNEHLHTSLAELEQKRARLVMVPAKLLECSERLEALRTSHAELGIECEALRLENERLRQLLERWREHGVDTSDTDDLEIETAAELDGEL